MSGQRSFLILTVILTNLYIHEFQLDVNEVGDMIKMIDEL